MRGLPRVESRIKLVSSGLSWDIPHLAFPIIKISHSGRVPGTIHFFSPERKTHKITNCPSSAMCGVPSHSDHLPLALTAPKRSAFGAQNLTFQGGDDAHLYHPSCA